ncbi:glycosyltransferase [Bacteriovoracaceae bacterium]|nr:glycosyltransferase [Bacteriovoracaceae bacterium]
MKVAILHDWLTGFRGGERVLEVFCEMYPEADLYTLIYQPGSTSKIIENRTIHTSFLDKIPGIYKHYRKFLPLFPLAAMSLKIPEDVDLVISSSHCVIKGVKKPSHAKHISYIHSPMRYLYDQYDTYFGPSAPFYQRLGAKVFKNYLVNWDKNSNSNVDVPIANARFVQQRIKKFYQIESGVIHPFVDLKDFHHIKENSIEKENFYIMVTAFAPNKRVDLAIRAFNKNGKNLKIIGSGQQEKELKEMANSNIEFLGNVSRDEVVTYFSKAQALIFPGTEDFGITPLESLAAGTPVIAFQYGGVLETLNDQVAVFFKEQSNESLEKAIEEFELKVFEKETLLQRANDFSRENFKNNIENLIKETMEGSNG